MYQAAVLPSLTDSTVVSATPAKSPPHQTAECEVRMVFVSTTGKFPVPSLTGFKASITKRNYVFGWYFISVLHRHYYLLREVLNQMRI